MNKHKITFTPMKWYVRLLRRLVRYLSNKGLLGGTRVDGRLLKSWLPNEQELKTAPEKRRLIAIAKKYQNTTLKKHFKNDGWDLDLHTIQQEILQEYLGFNHADIINACLVEGLKLDTVYRMTGTYITKRK